MRADLKSAELHVNVIRARSTACHILRSLVDGRDLRCFRCHRALPQDQFLPLRSGEKAFYLHPHCHACRKQARSKWAAYPSVTPALQRFVSKVITSARGGAHARDLIFALVEEDVLELWIKQDAKCALTGLPLVAKTHARNRISIDRIDSGGHYTRDNVHLVCATVNIMKSDMTVSQFRDWCKAVVLHGIEAEKAEAA